jgi:thioredoxin reductase
MYDVIVVGGGAAGLSGALMLARSKRSVLVIDAGTPRNAPAEGVHGLLGHDGVSPLELLERGRAEVRRYGGEVISGSVDAVTEGFTVTLADGRSFEARRILVTTGLVDELPEIPGLRERWGRDVVHCPYCHGWEVRDRPIGVISSGPMSVHQALLFRQLSDDVTFFTHTRPAPEGDDAAKLATRGIAIVAGEVAAVESTDDGITGVRLADGSVTPVGAVAVATRMVARAGLLGKLGLRPVEHPTGAGEYVPAEVGGRTEVPGVWVAGNVTDVTAQVGAAAAAGAMAGAMINADLVTEEATTAALSPREATGPR